ncbi:uncharacterized protein A1O9_03720 [Exophiala aquamarina CBS 119918]|uniref:polynucleotide adenylyltransferase n=1 Tax=Exophiala aquamarina CBS 119918 TaxID=1182545 RepID=A0A072PGK7_9EURO|nr:uncharacterized protein A1O9_03720 [Exophiala aquamarina CBS 119918]KEF58877.1 hypothetical protein A1O9_03720 [Exophiala aquamarina CBS 119918]
MDSYRPENSLRRRAAPNGDTYRPRRYDDHDGDDAWPPRNTNDAVFYFTAGRDRDRDRDRNLNRNRDRSRSPRNELANRIQRSYHPRRDQTQERPPRHRPHFSFKVSERPLLRLQHDAVEDPSLLQNSAGVKFRAIDELTDSDEEEMAQSEDEDQGRAKRIRTEHEDDQDAPAPKWSNPDPYTSLPPVQSGEVAKRKDVLRMIRKARLDADRTTKLTAQQDDYISFDVNDDKSEASLDLGIIQSLPHSDPDTPIRRAPNGNSNALGKRKRSDATGDIAHQKPMQPSRYSDRWVLSKWFAADDRDAAPWFTMHTPSVFPGVMLHNEIVKFYEWIRPRDFEERVRSGVFQRLSYDFQNCMAGELRAFGSYASRLYLPTGDMDLVFLTKRYRPGTIPDKSEVKSPLNMFERFLRNRRIGESIVVIRHAKVPIIKFVDRVSGLKVDLCFDNDSGFMAIDTFKRWKSEYPLLPQLVSIVKQFLMIRGLNDVATGGLGGFSTICLVTSFMQLYPRLNAMSGQAPNLGELLLEFFNFYGNVFDRDAVAIRLDPPGYVDKAAVRHTFGDKRGRLTIIDPNRPENNISGGTSQIQKIFHAFSLAHQGLLERLDDVQNADPDDGPKSFLEYIVGGDFRSYDTQRQTLYDLYDANLYVQQAISQIPPPPPSAGLPSKPPPPQPPPPPPPPPTSEATAAPQSVTGVNGNASNGKPTKDAGNGPKPKPKNHKARRRAERLKTLRPDLEPSIGDAISQLEAMKLGGYRTVESMTNDLAAREAATAEKLKAKKNK